MPPAATKQIEIFDPPMCCPGGVCGPAVDPALLAINEALLRLQKSFTNQVQVNRYVLSQQPAKFVQNVAIYQLLQNSGAGVLPVTCVDGRVVASHRYPTYDELAAAITQGTER